MDFAILVITAAWSLLLGGTCFVLGWAKAERDNTRRIDFYMGELEDARENFDSYLRHPSVRHLRAVEGP